MKPLHGQVAVVTGASRGIGRAIAERLALEGAAVMLTATQSALLETAAAAIRASGGQAATCTLDLRQPEAAARLTEKTLETWGGCSIVINNAGATKRGEFLQLSDADWADGYALKLFGAVRLARAAWPHLCKAKGSLLNIAGVGGRTPGAEFTIGGSVNAALLSFTKALADVGVRDGVQVNAINPGFVRTDRLTARLQAVAQTQGIGLDAAAAQMVRSAQVTRLGEPADIAGLVAFMVSPAGRFMQGSLVDMDGGQTKTL